MREKLPHPCASLIGSLGCITIAYIGPHEGGGSRCVSSRVGTKRLIWQLCWVHHFEYAGSCKIIFERCPHSSRNRPNTLPNVAVHVYYVGCIPRSSRCKWKQHRYRGPGFQPDRYRSQRQSLPDLVTGFCRFNRQREQLQPDLHGSFHGPRRALGVSGEGHRCDSDAADESIPVDCCRRSRPS